MIETVAEIGSTNRELLARLADGQPPREGHWLVADRQTGGQGRSGRVWADGVGNFMGSSLARLYSGDPPAPTLALVAGLAAVEALDPERSMAGLMLKWPNDLMVGGAKLGGILLERQGDAVVVGIGVNLAGAPSVRGRATTSLAALSCALPRDAFAARLATTWAALLERWHLGSWPALRTQWLQRAHAPGTPLSVRQGEQAVLTGSFAGLAEDGAALLRLADGTTRVIHAGEVDLVGGETVGAHATGY